MPRKKRLFIIIHLCFALSYLAWVFAAPKIKEIVTIKSKALLFESIINNQLLFKTLDQDLQSALLKGYGALSLEKGSYFANFSPSFFGLVWCLLSIALSLFLFFSSKRQISLFAWALPMLILAYGFFMGSSPTVHPDFFPTKEHLARYMNEGKRGQEKIIDGWNSYLIHEWVKEVPTEESYNLQVERGNFLFNVERAKWLLQGKGGDVTLVASLFTPSLLQYLFYLCWNLIFAWTITRTSKSEAASIST